MLHIPQIILAIPASARYPSLIMANFKALGLNKRASRGFDAEVDDRQFVGRGGFAPMFNDITDDNDVATSTNAHDEREYEHMSRLPSQSQYRDVRSDDGEWLGSQVVKTDPPMSSRVRDQVFNSIGQRVGTMTSKSLLDTSRGVGDYGNDGGLSNHATSYPTTPPLIVPGRSRRFKGGR